jgi:ABC-type Zn2+ transport system substrate-binding protein/surface adhesin
MKTMAMRSKFLSSPRGKSLVALIAVCGITGVSVMPAHADGNDKRDEHQDKSNHKDQGHGDKDHRDRNRRAHEEPLYYPQPIYAPPAVYYTSQQSPGISLFVPLDIHIR